MIDSTLSNILNSSNGPDSNSLLDILQTNNDDEEPNLFENSVYLNQESLVNVLKRKHNVFKVLSLNCQSLYAKYDQLCIYLSMLKENGCLFDAICLQETWLDEFSDLNALDIDGFELISKSKTCSAHGGLAIYLRNGIQYRSILTDTRTFNSWEHQFIEVIVNETTKTKLVIGNVYRLPRETNCDYDTFIEEFSNILEKLEQNQHLALFGDFNIDLLKIRDKPKVNEFFEMMLSKSLIAKITLPTRFSRNNATLIDNVFCKLAQGLSRTYTGILTNNMSDHQPYFISFDFLNLTNTRPKVCKLQKFDEDSFIKFKNNLNAFNFDDFLNFGDDGNPDQNYEKLDSLIHNLKEKHFPVKLVKFNKYRHKVNKWITRGIMNSIKFRDKLYARLKNTPPNTTLRNTLQINLSTYNKILKKNIRLAKSQYYHSIFEKFKEDIKNTWVTIKELINRTRNKKLLPNFFQIDGNSISDSQTIANKFNVYFNNIGPSLARNIVSPSIDFTSYLTNPVHQQFHFHTITEEMVARIIDNFPPKTSCGIDGMSMRFIKEIKNCILRPLCSIINQSLNTGIFPNKLKVAKIVPVYKNGDNTYIENYRPISVLPVLSKIFEKVMLIQLNVHFNSLNLLFSSQYGFREKHSTEFAAMENIDKIIESLEDRKAPLNIFLDLSKAFDTLDHNIMLHKLYHYGITGNAFELCKSYLTNRQQYVEYNGFQSDLLPIKTGVPQGSILGPLFFLIYVNDFDRSTNMFRFIMYADDTTLLATLSSVNNDEIKVVEQTLNTELKKVGNWLKVNKLSLNISKTKFMIFHPKNKQTPKIQLFIDNIPLVQVACFDFLGIIIDESISWASHLFKVQMKISKVLGVMNRLKFCLPSETLLLLYNSMILPHLLYGILLWGLKCNKLSRLQKRAVRIISKSKQNSHSDPLFKRYSILKVNDILKLQEWKFYYKYKNLVLPQYFLQFSFPRQIDIHPHTTRNCYLLVTPRLRYEFSKSSIKYRIPKMINEAPYSILNKISSHSLQGLSFYMKRVLINEYEFTCTLSNCYVCMVH
jgi:hypothetical protein